MEIYHGLRGLLKEQGYSTAVGDEGGFAPNLKSHEQALDLLVAAIEKVGLRPGQDVLLALDCRGQRTVRQRRVYVQEIRRRQENDR